MMTDKQQIEDMVEVIGVIRPEISHENGGKRTVICMCNRTNKEIAEALYNAGYRKVDENVVLLSTHDAELIAHELGIISPSTGKLEGQQIVDNIRKETAKEIINEIKRKYGKSCSEYYPLLIEITSEELDDLAKQYGVEVDE